MSGPYKKPILRHGEDFLTGVEALKLVLEDGKTWTFRIADEVGPIPDDPRLIDRENRRAAGRLAFWWWQEERALLRLKRLERSCDACEGVEYITQREGLTDHSGMEIPTEGNIRARIALSVNRKGSDLNSQKRRVEEARKEYGLLHALRVALEHRSHTLRALVKKHETEAG